MFYSFMIKKFFVFNFFLFICEFKVEGVFLIVLIRGGCFFLYNIIYFNKKNFVD